MYKHDRPFEYQPVHPFYKDTCAVNSPNENGQGERRIKRRRGKGNMAPHRSRLKVVVMCRGSASRDTNKASHGKTVCGLSDDSNVGHILTGASCIDRKSPEGSGICHCPERNRARSHNNDEHHIPDYFRSTGSASEHGGALRRCLPPAGNVLINMSVVKLKK